MKGERNVYVCFESKLTEVPHNISWMDYGSTNHVSNMIRDSFKLES